MRNKKKFVTSLLCGMSSFMLAAVPVMADAEVQKYTNTDFAMDTVVSETLYTTGEDLNTTIGDKLREIETGLLSWTDEDSQIAKLNAASGETVEVSDELAGYRKRFFSLHRIQTGHLTRRSARSYVSGILPEKIRMCRNSQNWMNF